MSNISGTVNAAGSNSATAAEGGSNGDDDDDDFPAALPYAHWRSLGNKRKFALHMIAFQESLSEGTIHTRTLTSASLADDDDDDDYSRRCTRSIGFIEQRKDCDRINLKFRPAGAPSRTVYIPSNELETQWEHVANAVTACPRPFFQEVVIDKIELTKSIMDMLGAALSTKRIDVFTLSYNNLDYTSLTSSYLENDPNVREFKVIGNLLQNAATALQFAAAIGNNEHMEKLEMKECGLGGNRPTKRTLSVIQHCCALGGNDSQAAEGNDILQAMLPHLNKLQSINIGHNDLTSTDVPYIASFIASDPEVKNMNLGFSDFHDSDATKFANALKTNSTIERLHLNGNEMTQKAKAKINAVAQKRLLSKALVVLNMSNRGVWPRKTGPGDPKILDYEHWRSLGYDMESSKAFVSFQNKLIGIANDTPKGGEFCFYKGTNRDVFDIDIDAYKAYFQCPLIAHHPHFLPHWKYAFEGLQNDSTRNVNKLGIKRVHLVSSAVDFLGNAMNAKNIVHLTLSQNHLDSQGYLSLSKFLDMKSPLKILELDKNPIDDVTCAKRFSKAIIAHPSIEKLSVDNCGLGDSIQILSAIASTMNRVSVLSLCWNDIGNDGAAVIGNLLSANPASLKTLHLSDHEIDDDGVTPFAEALFTNTNLRDLHLSRNDITALGESVLIEAVFDDTSLITLYNCNHTCKIYVKGHITPDTTASKKNTVKRKMSRAMFGNVQVPDNTRTIPMNMHLFSDAPVELMPVELGFINTCSKFVNKNKQPSLSNMYEVVRNWNVTVMFSYAAGAVAPKEKKKRRRKGENTTAKKAKSYYYPYM